MDRETMLKKIDELYEGRATGNQDAFEAILSPDATFTFEGDKSLVAAFPGGSSDNPAEVARALFEQIDMLNRRQELSIVEGNKVAVLYRGTLQVGGREPFEHLMFDLWEFNDDGKITSGRQFQDTAKLIAELKPI